MSEPLLYAHDVNVEFQTGRRANRVVTRACRDINLTICHREIVGLVGESGSGKTTFARVVSGLQPFSVGALWFEGTRIPAKRPLSLVRKIQMVFQDPYSSLEPTMTTYQTLAELLRAHHVVPANSIRARCTELLEMVQLPKSFLDTRPHAMSGGQRQRVAIARALALSPKLLIADEAVSALDVSVQAGIINLMLDLRDQLGLSILFIAHDLAVVRTLCDRTSVIYRGDIVEEGSTIDVFASPQHEYTKQLLASVPRIRGR